MLESARASGRKASPATSSTWTRFWQRAFMWCDFEWDAERLPDPAPHGRAPPARASATASGSTRTSPARARSTRKACSAAYFLRRAGRERVYDALVWSQRTERGHGALRHRRLHQSRGGPLVPGEARRPARARRRLVQAGLRRGDPEDAASRTGSPAPRCTTRIRSSTSRRRFEATQAARGPPRGRLVTQRGAGRPAVPGPLGGRLRSAPSSTWPTRSAAASPAR